MGEAYARREESCGGGEGMRLASLTALNAESSSGEEITVGNQP